MFAVAATLCIGAAPSVRIEPWGTDSLRVRVAPAGTSVATDLPTALVGELDRFEQTKGALTEGAKPAAPPVVSGNLRVVEVDGKRQFERVSDGQILLVESWLDHPAPGSQNRQGPYENQAQIAILGSAGSENCDFYLAFTTVLHS